MIPIELFLTCLWFICNAFVGGLGYICLHAHKNRWKNVRHLLLALLAGYVYFLAYREFNMPDGFVAIPIGWFAPDFIESIMHKFEKKLVDKEGKFKHG